MNKAKFTIIILLLIAGFTSPNDVKAQPGVSVNVDFNTFYDGLSPYGRWIDYPNYGRVWVYNEPGFRPYYTNGHWDYTEYGWTWASDYDWGWGPFHYGRWEEDPQLGWMWIPGYDWAPAWVSWSQDNDYYGWAPLGYGLDASVSLNMIPYDRWCYLPRAYITSPRFYDYCVPFERNRYIYGNTVVINNFYGGGGRRYFTGPNRGDVERYTHGRIEERRIQGNERYGFVQRGYRNNGFNRGGTVQGGNRGGFDNRNDSRQRVFGNRPDVQPRQNPVANNNNNQPRWQRGGDRGGNAYQQQPQVNAPVQQQRPNGGGNYNQPRIERGNQGGNPYRQQPQVNAPVQQQRQYGGGNSQPRAERPYSGGNSNGDQRNNNRTESRQRVTGEQRSSGNSGQQSGGRSERSGGNDHGGRRG